MTQDETSYDIVYGSHVERVDDASKACSIAEAKAEEHRVNTYVYTVKQDTREEDPFFRCEWEWGIE